MLPAIETEDREAKARRIAAVTMRSSGIPEDEIEAEVEKQWPDYADRLDEIAAAPAPEPVRELPTITWPTT